jgi:hypothetical protein
MQALAEEHEYQQLTIYTLEYLVVPGYPEEQPLQISGGSDSLPGETRQELPAEYTQSLVDWLRVLIHRISVGTGAAGAGGGN